MSVRLGAVIYISLLELLLPVADLGWSELETAAGVQFCWRSSLCVTRTRYEDVDSRASYVLSACRKLVHRGGASVWYS